MRSIGIGITIAENVIVDAQRKKGSILTNLPDGAFLVQQDPDVDSPPVSAFFTSTDKLFCVQES